MNLLEEEKYDIFKLFLKNGFDINICVKERNNYNLLFYLLDSDNYAFKNIYIKLKFLIKNGIDINTKVNYNFKNPKINHFFKITKNDYFNITDLLIFKIISNNDEYSYFFLRFIINYYSKNYRNLSVNDTVMNKGKKIELKLDKLNFTTYANLTVYDNDLKITNLFLLYYDNDKEKFINSTFYKLVTNDEIEDTNKTKNLIKNKYNIYIGLKEKNYYDYIDKLFDYIKNNNLEKIKEFLGKHQNLINSKNFESKTPLIYAAQYCINNTEIFDILLNYNPDKDLIDSNGSTALHIACEINNYKIIPKLITVNNLNLRDKHGNTPLLIALKEYNYECVITLLSNNYKIDVNLPDNKNSTPLMFAVSNFKNTTYIIDLLIKNGAERDVINHDDMSALYIACLINNPEAIPKIITGGNADFCNFSVTTPLMVAFQENNYECIIALLKSQYTIDVNIKDYNSLTPLMQSLKFYSKFPEILDLLIKNGADKNMTDKLGNTALHLACRDNIFKAIPKLITNININLKSYLLQQTPISMAVSSNSYESVKLLLSLNSYSVDLNITYYNKNDTLLMVAVNSYNSTTEMIDLLINNGISKDKINLSKSTALHFACEQNRYDLIPKLITEKNVNFKNENDETPLLISLKKKYYKCAYALLSTTASYEFNKNNVYLMESLLYMIENNINNEEIFQLLMKNKAFIRWKQFKKNINKIISNSYYMRFMIMNGFYIYKEEKLQLITTPLIFSIQNNLINFSKKILMINNDSVNEKDENQKPCLFYSMENKNDEYFKLIIDCNKLNIEVSDGENKNALMYALILNKEMLIKSLLFKYIDIYEKDINEKEILKNIVKLKYSNLYNELKDYKNTIDYEIVKSIINKYNNEETRTCNIEINDNFKYQTNNNNNNSNNGDEDINNKYYKNKNDGNDIDNNNDNDAEVIIVNEGESKDFEEKINQISDKIVEIDNYINTEEIDYLNTSNENNRYLILLNEDLYNNENENYDNDIDKGNNNNTSQKNTNSNIKNLNFNSNSNSNNLAEIKLAIKEKNYKSIKRMIENLTSENINDFCNGKTIMSHLIDNVIDDEEIYNIMFKKGAYIDYSYISNNKNNKSILIEKNIGLIRSIVNNGIFTITGKTKEINHIKTPVIFFLNNTKNAIVQLLLDYGASINESDDNGLTPIFYAIKSNNVKLCEVFLNKYHADITIKNSKGQTPMQYVLNLEKCDRNIKRQFIFLLSNNNQENTNSIIKDDSNINIDSNSYDLSAIMIAIKDRNYKNIKIMIKSFTARNINDFYNRKTIMSQLIDNVIDDEEIYNIMFEKGAYICRKYIINNFLNHLIVSNTGLIKSIIRNGIIVKSNDEVIYYKFPVIFSVLSNKINLVEALLNHGGSIEETDEQGNTPVFYTIKTGNAKLIKLLLTKYHPNISIKNKNGLTPLEYASSLYNYDKNTINTIITELKNYSNKNIIENSVNSKSNTNTELANSINSKSDINTNANNKTEISTNVNNKTEISTNVNNKTEINTNVNNKTVISNNLKTDTNTNNTLNDEIDNLMLRVINLMKDQKSNVYKTFLKEGRMTNVNKYYNGKTIMSHLIDDKIDNEELFNMLFSKGAYIDPIYLKDVPKKYLLIKQNKGLMKSIIRHGLIIGNPEGNKINYTRISTPVMYFIKHGKVSVAISLLENNANANEMDEEGFTPLFQAIKSNHHETFYLLLNKFNADITVKNKRGQTPLMYALQRDPRSIYVKELQKYDKKNDVPAVTFTEIKENVDTTESNEDDLNRKKVSEIQSKANIKTIKKSKSMKDIKEELLIKVKPDDAILNQVSDNKEVINNYLNSQQFSNVDTTNDSNSNDEKEPMKIDSLLLLASEYKEEEEEEDEEEEEEEYDESMNLNYIINYLGRKYKSINPSKIIYTNDDDDNTNACQEISNDGIKMNNSTPQEVHNNDVKLQQNKNDNVNSQEHQNNNVNSQEIQNNDVNTYEIQNNDNNLEENQNSDVNPKEIQYNDVNPQAIQKNNVKIQENQNDDVNLQEIKSDNINEETNSNSINIDKDNNNIENTDISEYSDLHYACIQETIEIIALLVESGLYDINSPCFDGSTPLLVSIKFGKIKSVEEILKYNPDLTIADNEGETPLSYLLKHPSTKSNNILSLLLPQLSLKQTYSPDRLTPLYYLIKYDNKEGIQKLSQSPEFNIDELDEYGDSALLHLLKQESINFELVELVLQLGANVNFENQEHKIPLIYAIEQQNIDLVRLLIKYKADVNYKLKNSMTPLKYTILLNNVALAKELLAVKK